MQFEPLEIDGAFLVSTESFVDERGAFCRTFSAGEFAEHGLVDRFVQHSISVNSRRGTVRGLHFQARPLLETKLVRCIRGSVFDVILDLRHHSRSFRRWQGITLSAANRNAAYVPQGCAHGFQTLEDDCEVEYLITPEYVAAAARGVRWDDPVLGIAWPITTAITISSRDQDWPTIEAVGLS